MDQETLKQIFAERSEDWSAQTIENAKFTDLSGTAMQLYRNRWAEHTKDPARRKVTFRAMLTDLQLMKGEKLTAAALLLFGTEQALAVHIPDAEIIFEWRNNEQDIAYGERKNWRIGFMSIQDEIWKTINARNTIFRYQEGFAQRGIPAFDEESIREAAVNAFAHRDYTVAGRSIVIKASPARFYIENPGRLMPGVTLDNIFDRSEWRNRCLAESLEKVHVMERSSQGVDKIFRHTIEAGKGLPVFSVTQDPTVKLEIPASLKDQKFVDFLEKVTNKQQASLSLKEIIELEQIREGSKTASLDYRDKFLELGIIERIGHGRGARYILAHQYYEYTNALGQHTRLSGLSKEVKRSIILKHLHNNKHITNHELQEAMPDMAMREIYRLLNGLKADGLIEHVGSKRYGYWRATTSH